MTLEPFFEASLAIQIHMIAAMGAFFLGAVVLWRRKGNTTHKQLGKVWVLLMLVTSFSAFFIHEIQLWGNYSPIHILAVTTPISLVYAIYAARKGKIQEHLRTMKATYIGGMVIAGGFTFLPGRLNYEMLFGDSQTDVFEQAGGWLIPIILAGLIALYFSRRRPFEINK
jgi:uncharacterized membrane protein